MSEPKILSLQWGQIIVENGLKKHVYKDCRIWPTGSEVWDWSRTETHHVPGIQFEDFKDLLENFPDTEIIILSQGMHNKLQIHPETLAILKKDYPSIDVQIMNTVPAVKFYNEKRTTKKILGLFHSTC